MNHLKAWIDEHFKGDPMIWAIVILLSMFSILVVYSATGTLAYKTAGGNTELYLFRHSFLVFLSLFVMWLAHKMPYRKYALYARLFMYLSIPLLAVTFFFGDNINEANRWLTIPVINQAFQPSDLAKLSLIAALAAMLAKRQNNIEDLMGTLLPIIISIGAICALIGMANMSTAILLLLTCLLIMFIGRVPVKHLALVVMVGLMGLSIAVLAGQRVEHARGDMRHPGHHEEVADADAGRARHAVGDQAGAVWHPRHPQPRVVQPAARGVVPFEDCAGIGEFGSDNGSLEGGAESGHFLV